MNENGAFENQRWEQSVQHL